MRLLPGLALLALACRPPHEAPSATQLGKLADTILGNRPPPECTRIGSRQWRAGWRSSDHCVYRLPDGSGVALNYDPWRRLTQLNRTWLGLSKARSVAITDSIAKAMRRSKARPLAGPTEQKRARGHRVVYQTWCLDSAIVMTSRAEQTNNPKHIVSFVAAASDKSPCSGR